MSQLYKKVGNKLIFVKENLEEGCIILDPKLPKCGIMGLGFPAPIINSFPDVKLLLEPVKPLNLPEQQKFSIKLVLGNVMDYDDEEVLRFMKPFGVVQKVESINGNYCIIRLRHSNLVEKFLEKCSPAQYHFNYRVSSESTIIVHPFALEDQEYTIDETWPKYVRYTIFIGKLPRACTAAFLLNYLKIELRLKDVLHVRIECDKELYPRGAARAVFKSEYTYRRACSQGRRRTQWFGSEFRIEFKSFIYNGFACEHCGDDGKSNFCDDECLRYFCDRCWGEVHSHPKKRSHRQSVGPFREIPYVAKHYNDENAAPKKGKT